MKVKVVVGTLFANGNKYARGDIFDTDDINLYGTRVEPYVAPKVEKPKPAPKVEASKPAPKKKPTKRISVRKVSDES